MTDGIRIRKAGPVGRITLDRPEALNALTWPMALAIEVALDAWAADASVRMVVLDATGPRAFCAGGDIAEMYATASDGDFGYGRRFWRDEYRLNVKLHNFRKPVASFLQGYTMGGGVGVGCHGSYRIVGDSSVISMPECGIGLVPDAGGSLILARAPGRLGEYLGVTGARMGPGDAILATFADHYIPEAEWPALIAALEEGGDWTLIDEAARSAPPAPLAEAQAEIDSCFGAETFREALIALREADTDFAHGAMKLIERNSPLSMACAMELIARVRGEMTIEAAVQHEFRFTWRSAEFGDFVEGIRAKIIDRDNAPRWRHPDAFGPSPQTVGWMLAPLGEHDLQAEDLR